VEKAFRIILKDPTVKAILVNISVPLQGLSQRTLQR
jgi:succinyl-CoA synthetase beta subunit